MVTKKASKPQPSEVEVYEGAFRILDAGDDSMADILAENFVGDDGFTAGDLTRVKFPREGDAWQFEDAGEKRIEAEIVGVPVRQQVSRTFYLAGYEEGSNDAPDCRSNDGTTGIIVPERDPEAIAAAVMRLAGDGALRRRLGEAGRQAAAARFGWARAAERFEAAYRRALASRSAGR